MRISRVTEAPAAPFPENAREAQPARVSRRLRVAHVAARLSLAGMESVVASLVRGLPEDRYDCDVWCLEAADVLGEMLRAEGRNVIELGKKARRDPGLFLRVDSMIRERGIDVLHCHDELSWFYGAIGARLSGRARILVTMHGRRPGISRRHLWEQRALAAMTSNIVTVSSYLQQQILKEILVLPDKTAVIRNGIPLMTGETGAPERQKARAALGIPEDALVVGSVGRLEGVKNFGLLIAAAGEAARTVPGLRAVLIGDGSCRQDLEAKSAELGLGDRVTFAGIRKNVQELLPGLDIYICSSNYEGISLSVLEAMAAARPVIATAVGGNCELVAPDKTGVLVEKGNAADMAQAIVRLAQDPECRARLGNEARRTAETNFSLERMIQDYDRLYQNLEHLS